MELPSIIAGYRVVHRRINLLCYALVLLVAIVPQASLAAPEPPGSTEPAVPPLGAGPFGLNTHLATRYPDAATMDLPAAVVAESGTRWAREDIHWYRVQPDANTWDWSHTDAAMRALLGRGIEVVGVLGHPPGWATPYPGDDPGGISFYAPDVQQFAAYAQAVVQRYGQYVHHWEIWNEPDNPQFWMPAPDPLVYVSMLRRTAVAIRSVDPQAKLIIGGLNAFDSEFLRRVGEAGAWDSFDIIGLHPYVDPTAPELGQIGAAADAARALAARFGARPIWVTEVGWSSGPGDRDANGRTTEDEQASYLVRAMLLLWRSGVERVFWYTLKDDPHNRYGLVPYGEGRADFSRRKPAFEALRTLNRMLGGATYAGIRDLFTRTVAFDFETLGAWRRGEETVGSLSATASGGRAGTGGAALRYSFTTRGNDFALFMRDQTIPLPQDASVLGIWVYGDGSGSTLKVWLRDADGELLQFPLGTVGPPGWRFLQAPIYGEVAAWNRMTGGGNGRLDGPARLYALVLDDAPDSHVGSGTIYLDDLTALSGPEAYDLQVRRGDELVDVLWAPASLRARLPVSTSQAQLVARDGRAERLVPADGGLALDLGPAPIYIRHGRP